jgi:hypothetical protein
MFYECQIGKEKPFYIGRKRKTTKGQTADQFLGSRTRHTPCTTTREWAIEG